MQSSEFIQKNAKPGGKSRRFLPVLLLLLVTALVLSPVLSNGFLDSVDDNAQVLENTHILSLSGKAVAGLFSAPHAGLYNPLTLLSHAVEYRLFGFDPAAFHATNLLLHLVNVLLVFWLFALLTEDRRAALITAALFALHPLQVEPVAWITARKDVLFAPFFLASLGTYLLFLRKEKNGYYALSLALFVLSLLAKPMAVSLPAVLLCLALFLRKYRGFRTLLQIAPFLLIALFFVVVNVQAQYTYIQRPFGSLSSGPWQRVTFASFSLLFYCVKALLPVNLSCQYAFPKTGSTVFLMNAAPFVVALAGAALALFRRRARPLLYGVLFYCLTILPAVNLVPFGVLTAGDRYAYIPLLGLFAVAAGWASRFFREKGIGSVQGKAAVAVLLALLACWSLLSRQRCGVWKNSIVLLEDTVRRNPGWAYGYRALAEACMKAGMNERAIDLLHKAVKLDWTDADSWRLLGSIYLARNENDAALEACHAAVELAPGNPENSAQMIIACARRELFKTGEDIAVSALRIDGGSSTLYNSMGILREAQKDYAAAEEMFTTALSLEEGNATARYNRALLFLRTDRTDEAVRELEAVVRQRPSHVEAWNNLGTIYAGRREYVKAFASYDAAQRAAPGLAATRYNRGNLLLSLGRLAPAAEEYEAAFRLSGGRDFDACFNLGVVLLRSGDADAALRQFETARKIAVASGDRSKAQDSVTRLKTRIQGSTNGQEHQQQ